jgi:ubiquinone/menaquinone biosynthesis C-methylase UbiE
MSKPVHHPVFARIYARFGAMAEAKGVAAHRDELLAGLTGRVAEVGAGNGLNFAHYPVSVAEVVAVEPEPYLRERAIEAAGTAPVPVSVTEGTADRLPLDGASCDAGVVSLVLCSLDDVAAGLAELRRVIRPGGELRFYEHVLSDRPRLARVQRLVDRTFWPRVAGGCHTARDTLASIREAGFVVEDLSRFEFRPAPAVPTTPHILGSARRP